MIIAKLKLGATCLFVSFLLLPLACTKNIVEQDAIITPTGASGDTLPAEQSAGAGDASEGSDELRTIHFAFDSYVLRPDAVTTLKANAEWLKRNASAKAQIEGHCDERGTVQYNIALGERRAEASRAYLVKLGIDRNRLSVISYGKERPEDPAHNERAWATNRRDVFVLLGK